MSEVADEHQSTAQHFRWCRLIFGSVLLGSTSVLGHAYLEAFREGFALKWARKDMISKVRNACMHTTSFYL